jgi:phosphatidylglycerophosphate synthase
MAQAPFFSVPNILSLSRLGLAAAFVVSSTPGTRVGLVALAGATDFLDGWLARRSQSQSRWGALLDPITDRMFVLCALGVYLVEGVISTTEYFVIISRDLMTAIGFIVAKSVSWLRPVTFRARTAGKIVTALQLAVLIALIIRQDLVNMLLIALGITSVVAILDYTLLLWRERERSEA